MEREKKDKLPEFQSLEEEKEYWEARGPLAEGRKGRINKSRPNQKRSSFLSIRLTGEEISSLREVAAIFYTRPSEFARGAILDAVKRFKSLYEMDKKERERLEGALKKEIQPYILNSLDMSSLLESLRNRTQEQGFNLEHSFSLGNDLTINFATHEVFLSGKQVNLTPREYYLLSELVRQELDNSLSRAERATR
jgi:hypothetical protein